MEDIRSTLEKEETVDETVEELGLSETLDEDLNDEDVYDESNLKNRVTSGGYASALRGVVFGSLAVTIALFAVLFNFTVSSAIATILAIGALVIAIVGLVSACKARNDIDTKTAAMAKTGTLVSVLATILAALALIYIIITIILTIIYLVIFVVLYVGIIIFSVLMGMMAAGM